VIDSLQLSAKHRVATPVNWKRGEDVIAAGSVTDEAKTVYPDGGTPRNPTCGLSAARSQLIGGYRALHSPSAPAIARLPAQTRLRSSPE
jgi:hypothetical protein